MAADAEEVLDHAEILARIDLPDRLAVVGRDAVEHAFGGVDVDAVFINNGTAARAVVVAVLVAVVGRVLELPDEVAGVRLQTGEASFVVGAIEDEQPAFADRGWAVTAAHLLVPDDLEPLLG